MRIGLRRLRAAIVAFEKVVADEEQKRINAELKWITNELGPARDLDVFEADVLQPIAPPMAAMRNSPRHIAPSSLPAPRPMGRRQGRCAPTASAPRCSTSPSGSKPVTGCTSERLRKRREETIVEHAAKLLSRGRKRIRENGADFRALDVKKRHKLRIRAKNLRYAVEFFAGVFPDERNTARREAALKALKELQDQLGALNDLAQREALAANGHDLGDHAHDLLTPKVADIDQLLDRAQKAQADFAKVKSFWK